jgi:hypothetical protein
MNTKHDLKYATLLAAMGMFCAMDLATAAPQATNHSLPSQSWQQIQPNVYQKENADGSIERVEIKGNVQPDALHSTTGVMCVPPSGPLNGGYAYQFDSDIANGLLGTTAIARAHVNTSGIAPTPTSTTVLSTASVSNGATIHIVSNSGGYDTIVSAVANFDFYPRPVLCSAGTTSSIELKGGACTVTTTVSYTYSSDCTD